MWWLRIEFSRVQTFLFAVPRLADILGANTLLGETLRYTLYRLAIDSGSRLSAELIPDDLSSPFPVNDPLEDDEYSVNTAIGDNPKHLYGQGILARDGGHFGALFPDRHNADTFKRLAAELIRKQLPGLVFSIAEPLRIGGDSSETTVTAPASLGPETASLPGLPSLQICEESSRGVASKKTLFSGEARPRHYSLAVAQRKKRGQDFSRNNANNPPLDIASLITRLLPDAAPTTFDQLCGRDYLALIHADGNGIGDWSKRLRGDAPKDASLQAFIAHEAKGEKFYHAMRVAVRGAVKVALEQVFHGTGATLKVAPYRILMLGGDDLLLACRAPDALRFVVAYAKALEKNKTLPSLENDPPVRDLTVGVGVAIAKPGFPFHRLHQIAEQLAGSAKRLIRGEQAAHASVVDWTVCTEAWLDDLADARSANVVRYRCGVASETLALSSKPYRVLKSAKEPTAWTLERLLEAADDLAAMPRSQRRALVNKLGMGRRHADLCMQMLKRSSPPSWKALNKAGLVNAQGGSALWTDYDGGCYATVYADIVEITEIPHLHLAERDVADTEEAELPVAADNGVAVQPGVDS